mmetsp:Transcript_18518/g.31700  ORF Transcript_18518/g.31700 Transcript_18518/m.31700 type:complete len:81 (-) Transcript_18518:71-313(-)
MVQIIQQSVMPLVYHENQEVKGYVDFKMPEITPAFLRNGGKDYKMDCGKLAKKSSARSSTVGEKRGADPGSSTNEAGVKQ